MKEDSVK